MHFRDKHSLCEHPDCLSKKFIVFVSETELKVCVSSHLGFASLYADESCLFTSIILFTEQVRTIQLVYCNIFRRIYVVILPFILMSCNPFAAASQCHNTRRQYVPLST